MSRKPECRHCGQHPVTRPRRLCWVCYYTPGVKEQYGPESGYARRSPVPAVSKGKLPEPLPDLVPGSEAKIAAMAERAERGMSLFHPHELQHTTATERYEVPEVKVCELEK